MRNTVIFIALLNLFGCIQEIALFEDSFEYLVIDGHLDDRIGRKSIRVYYAASYNQLPDYNKTKNSDVRVVDNLGNEVKFMYRDYGVFVNDNFTPIIGRSYKVKVLLESGGLYESQPDTLFAVPAIERIWFERDQGISQLNFYVDFQDDATAKNYYRWRFKNTYEFVAPLAMEKSLTNQRLENSQCFTWEEGPPLANEVAVCWVDLYDNQYLKIENDHLFNGRYMTDMYVFSIPLDRKFDRGYYVNAQQHSLSQSGYKYWKAIQEQMENKGTIFEKTNYQIKGNISSMTNPDELVLGFFGMSSVASSSVYIGNYLGLWGDVCCNCSICPPAKCYDCRKVGAYSTNVKPAFWP